MNPKPIIIACIFSMLFVGAVYFGGKWVLEAERVEEWNPAVRKDTPDDENETAPDTKETEAETEKPPPPRASPRARTSRGYKSIEELLANASPEERRRWAEISARIQAEGNNATDSEGDALLKESEALRQENAKREAELAADNDFAEWAAEVRQRHESGSDMQVIEDAKRTSELHQAHLDEFKRKLQQWGLWDYETNQPKTTQ